MREHKAFMRSCSIKRVMMMIVAVLAAERGLYADFKDDFEGRTTGVYLSQAREWHHPGDVSGVYDSPVVVDNIAFSGSRCLSNANDPVNATNEQLAYMEGYINKPAKEQDVTISFMFRRTTEQGNPFWNKIRMDVYDSTGNNRVAVAAYNGRIYDDNMDINVINNIGTNAWWKMVLAFQWNHSTSSYGNLATVTIYDANNSFVAQSYVQTSAGSLAGIARIQISMHAGWDGQTMSKPTCYIDDLSIGMKPVVSPRPSNIGLKWVYNRPYRLTALVQLDTAFDVPAYTGAGLNGLLSWDPREPTFQKAANGKLPWWIYGVHKRALNDPNFNTLILTDRSNTSYLINTYAGNEAILQWDESRHVDLNYANDNIRWSQQNWPQSLSYTNVYSGGAEDGKYWSYEKDSNGNWVQPPQPYPYPTYLDDVVSTSETDVLSVDIYPYITYSGERTYIAERYFYTLEKVRERGLTAGIPYWIFLQACQSSGTYYLPSDSDLRMNVFSSLAYGFSAIQYFLYHDPAYSQAIVDPDPGNPLMAVVGDFYPIVQAVNQEAAYIGRVIRVLTSTDVAYIPGSHYSGSTLVSNSLPTGAHSFNASSSSAQACGITSVQVNDVHAYNDALLGFFEDVDGDPYFMLVNLRRSGTETSANAAVSLTITFNSSVQQLYRVNRSTGLGESVPLNNHTLTLTLPGGTGDLFKMNDAGFAGFDLLSVPN